MNPKLDLKHEVVITLGDQIHRKRMWFLYVGTKYNPFVIMLHRFAWYRQNLISDNEHIVFGVPLYSMEVVCICFAVSHSIYLLHFMDIIYLFTVAIFSEAINENNVTVTNLSNRRLRLHRNFTCRSFGVNS